MAILDGQSTFMSKLTQNGIEEESNEVEVEAVVERVQGRVAASSQADGNHSHIRAGCACSVRLWDAC